MYGLTAITQANGWAMAGTGACIVLSGLAVLSFLISMIPRLTGLFEEKPQKQKEAAEPTLSPAVTVPAKLPDDIEAAVAIYIEMTADLGDTFSLVDLHCKSKEVGLPHPHISINRFRDAGVLISAGDGLFSWKPVAD